MKCLCAAHGQISLKITILFDIGHRIQDTNIALDKIYWWLQQRIFNSLIEEAGEHNFPDVVTNIVDRASSEGGIV
jgi:hypothetical protein